MKDISGREILEGDEVAAAVDSRSNNYSNPQLCVCKVISFSEKMVRLECDGRKFSKIPNKISVIIKNRDDERLQ